DPLLHQDHLQDHDHLLDQEPLLLRALLAAHVVSRRGHLPVREHLQARAPLPPEELAWLYIPRERLCRSAAQGQLGRFASATVSFSPTITSSCITTFSSMDASGASTRSSIPSSSIADSLSAVLSLALDLPVVRS